MPNLDTLRKLPYGWDGGNAEPPSEESIRLAEAIISATPVVLPHESGGVVIEWRDRAQSLLLVETISREGTFDLE